MSVFIQVKPEFSLLYVRGDGDLTESDVSHYYERLEKQEEVKNCYRALIDTHTSKMTVTHLPVSSIKSMSKQFKQAPLLPKGAKMAVVVHSILGFGFVRLFMSSRGDEALEIRPFRSMEQALLWLDVSQLEFETVLEESYLDK